MIKTWNYHWFWLFQYLWVVKIHAQLSWERKKFYNLGADGKRLVIRHGRPSIQWAATWENKQCGFWPGLTQTRLYSHWRWLEVRNHVFRKKRYCTIHVAKTKALISLKFAVTKLICVFVFAYAKRWFSHDAAPIMVYDEIEEKFRKE